MRDYIAPGSKTAVLGKEDSRPAYDQAASPRPMPSHQHLLPKLQQQYGNQYMQRALDISRRNGGNLVKPGPRMPSPVKVLSLQRKDEIQRIPVEEEEEALQPGSLAKSSENQERLQMSRFPSSHKGSAQSKVNSGGGSATAIRPPSRLESASPHSIQRTIGDGHDLASSRFSGNVILEAVFDNERALRRGNSGAAVRLVYELPQHGADGDFGSETEAAVRAFQIDTGLNVDGVVGFRTIEYLDARDRG
jgi:peptidoglycan hydrolase-like protein with peptidoglycan-binding domain